MNFHSRVFFISLALLNCFYFTNAKANPDITWEIKKGSSNLSFFHRDTDLSKLAPIKDEKSGKIESAYEQYSRIFSVSGAKEKYMSALEEIVKNYWITEWNDYKNEYRSTYATTACENGSTAAFCQEITLKISDPSSKYCLWSIDDKSPVIGLCEEFSTNVLIDKDLIVKARLTDGSDNVIQTTVHVEGKVILALGDSFASGEGNPDRPTKHDDEIPQAGTEYSFFLSRGDDWKRPLDEGPLWLDRTCHRSMLSHQFKIALQYATENPKQRIVFVSFSCSGAEIINGLLQPQKDLPYAVINRGERSPLSQLDSAVKFLCGVDTVKNGEDSMEICMPPATFRIPDLILLSIGGNDVGFGPLTSNTFSPKLSILPLFSILSLRLTFPYFDILQGVKHSMGEYKNPSDAEEMIKESLPGSYKALNAELKKRGLIKYGNNVIQTNYPDLLVECNQDWNRQGNLGFKIAKKEYNSLGSRGAKFFTDSELPIPFLKEWLDTVDISISENESSEIRKKVIVKLQEEVKKNNNNYKWVIVGLDENDIKDYNLCALDKTSEGSAEKTFRFPYRGHEGDIQKWQDGFKPSEWKHYSPERQRCSIRLMIQS